MELYEEKDSFLVDHIKKCRFCFSDFIDEKNTISISPEIEQTFFDLTQVQLLEADVFSSRICHLCFNDLEAFNNFRNDLVQKQQKLYSSMFVASSSIKNEFVYSESMQEEKYKENSNGDNERRLQYESKKKIASIFECEKCNFIASSWKFLKDHENKAHQLLYCDKCNFNSETKSVLEQHLNEHFKEEFSCQFCKLKYHKKHLLNRHIRLKHTVKERKYRCTSQACDKAFCSISALKKHSESHSKKDIVCEHCGKLFSCLNNLRTHLYYHSEPKFVCDIEGCGKKFFMRKLLKAHLNVHLGQKNFKCEFCEKSYFFQAHLKRHIISMHMRLKFDCELCSSSFARKESYRSHVMNQHQNIGKDALEELLMKIRNMRVEYFKTNKD